jgi:replicative DNA helicase
MSSLHDLHPAPVIAGLKGDTLLVHASSAWPVTLEELLDRRDPAVLSMGDAAVIRPERATSYVLHEPPALYRLTTYTGRSIDAAGDQRFLTRGGWRTLSTLAPTDAVAIVAEYPDFFGRGETDPELVKLLAYLTSAGTMGDGLSPSFVDPDVRCDFEHAVNAKGDACRPIDSIGGETTPRQVHGRFGAHSKVLSYLELVGVHGVAAHNMFVPDFVFGLKRATLRLFLNRLFTMDGQIETSGRLIYRTASLRMARQVQHLLARFGVVSLLRGLEHDGVLEAVDLVICTKADVLRFIDEVGFFGEKAHRAEEVRAALYHVRMVDVPLGRLGPILFDRVFTVELIEAAPIVRLVFETTHNFIASDFIVEAEGPHSAPPVASATM